MQDTVY